MNKRNLAAEILAGLNEFQAWRDGKRPLRASKPPRIPRLVSYQTKGQLPLTLLALLIILLVVFVYWIIA